MTDPRTSLVEAIAERLHFEWFGLPEGEYVVGHDADDEPIKRAFVKDAHAIAEIAADVILNRLEQVDGLELKVARRRGEPLYRWREPTKEKVEK